MPELIEVEAYRQLAELALERKIVEVVAPDAWWLKGGLSADVLSDALPAGTSSLPGAPASG